ncbi:MAG: PD40 domain-containing protein [Planctomycetes bacterium]|nr:PD40 domain-containing protein [Planctomycetota bacterium]
MRHAITLLCCSLLPIVAAAQDAPPSQPAATGELAFARGGAILLLDVATGEETVLVDDNQYDRPLSWMPDGKRLLFWNHAGGAWDLWSVEVATKARTNLTKSARDNRSPAPSPEGTSIAFHRGGDGVWLMKADGSGQHQLDPRGHRDAAPCWSTDGRRLAFTSLQPVGESHVRFAMHLLTLEDGAATAHRDLGDGEACAFLDEHRLLAIGAHEGAYELLVVDTRDGSRKALTHSAASDRNAVLSPDRSRIVWVVPGEAANRVMSMNVDGGEVRDLAPMQSAFAPPAVSPDGRFVVFESGPDRRSLQLQLVPIGGGEVRQLTERGGQLAVWRPGS